MEKKIASAEAVHIDANIKGKHKDKEAKLHASFTIARGDKVRIKLKGTAEDKDINLDLFFRHGKNLRVALASEGIVPKLDKTPTNFTAILTHGPQPRRHRRRLKAGPHAERKKEAQKTEGGEKGKEVEPKKGVKAKESSKAPTREKLFAVTNFKAGEAEKVDGKEAKVIHYDLKLGGKDEMKVTLWLNARSLLPLKCRLVVEKEMVDVTETYKQFKLNPQVDPEIFNLK